MKGEVLIAGIGNIFLGDDAFGVEVIQRLSGKSQPAGVVVKDFGIRGYDLAFALMQEWDLAILVDALPLGGEAGTVYTLEPELPASAMPVAPDAHSMNPVAVLQLVGAMGGTTGRVLVVGCEPAAVDPDQEGTIGLSEPVAAAVDEAINVIEGLITRVRSQSTAA
jgi:hydrogenase maturation protease